MLKSGFWKHLFTDVDVCEFSYLTMIAAHSVIFTLSLQKKVACTYPDKIHSKIMVVANIFMEE